MRPRITRMADTEAAIVRMIPPTAVSSRPPLAYVWFIRSLSAALLGAGGLLEGVHSLEDLLIDDEDHGDQKEREDRRDSYPDQPVPAFLLTSGDPALDRRQPQEEQEEAGSRVLVEALVEDGVAVTSKAGAVLPALEPESLE